MKKKVIGLLLAVSLVMSVVALGAVAVAKSPNAKVPNGPAGKSDVAHLYLFEKDPATWELVENGSWGKMKYNLEGPEFEFVFNGHGLENGSEYTLIYYPDPWPGSGLICLGSGTACDEGDVHIKEAVNSGDLPAAFDANEGAKIWLVLSSDVDCENAAMVGWTPTEYLFEYDIIKFDDRDE
jgi:hypothetical protein